MTDVLTPIQLGAQRIDLSPRIAWTSTVVASPADNTETTIASLTIPGGIAVEQGILLIGFAAYTVGTSGVSVNLKIRKTDTSGSTIAATGATTAVAADLGSKVVIGDATTGAAEDVYVLTMTVASGAAASTVSAVGLVAVAI